MLLCQKPDEVLPGTLSCLQRNLPILGSVGLFKGECLQTLDDDSMLIQRTLSNTANTVNHIDSSGNLLLTEWYAKIEPFEKGKMLSIKVNGEKGFLDTKLQFYINESFQHKLNRIITETIYKYIKRECI